MSDVANAPVRPVWSADTEDLAHRITGRVIVSHRHMFELLPEFDDDDLQSECLLSIRDKYEKWDPARCGMKTCMYRAARNRLVDLFRQRQREARREAKVAQWKPGHSEDQQYDGEDNVVEWTKNIYAGIVQRLERYTPTPPHRGPGRPSLYTNAQVLACHALKRHLNLSVRGLEKLLAGNPELRSSLRLDRTPNRDFLHKTGKGVSKFKSFFVLAV